MIQLAHTLAQLDGTLPDDVLPGSAYHTFVGVFPFGNQTHTAITKHIRQLVHFDVCSLEWYIVVSCPLLCPKPS